MTTLTVLKAFNTVNRRFKPGNSVEEAEIVAPLDLADMKKRRFVAGTETKAAEAAVEKASADEPSDDAKNVAQARARNV